MEQNITNVETQAARLYEGAITRIVQGMSKTVSGMICDDYNSFYRTAVLRFPKIFCRVDLGDVVYERHFTPEMIREIRLEKKGFTYHIYRNKEDGTISLWRSYWRVAGVRAHKEAYSSEFDAGEALEAFKAGRGITDARSFEDVLPEAAERNYAHFQEINAYYQAEDRDGHGFYGSTEEEYVGHRVEVRGKAGELAPDMDVLLKPGKETLEDSLRRFGYERVAAELNWFADKIEKWDGGWE